jgi:hypothetical protein
MPMPPYTIHCYHEGCDKEAEYKIASQWSDGVTGELKCYFLCCKDHLAGCFAKAKDKEAACRIAPGESRSHPGIYRLDKGKRDLELTRLAELEAELDQ